MTQEEALQELIRRGIVKTKEELAEENFHFDNKLQEYVRQSFNGTNFEENATNLEIISLIVDADPQLVTRENYHKHSAFRDAVFHDKRPIIDLFLEKIPDLIFHRDSRNENIMHYFARRTKFDEYVLAIAQKNPAALRTYSKPFGFAPIHTAIDNSNPDFFNKLYRDNFPETFAPTQHGISCSEMAFKKHDYKLANWFSMVTPKMQAKAAVKADGRAK